MKKHWAKQRHAAEIPHGLQMSEAFRNNIFLAMSGGLQDAYTYNIRQGVFSNAQTGNVVLMSQHLLAGEWQDAVRYLFPLISFVLGIFIVERIQNRYRYAKRLHWRQGILIAEAVILFIVGFIPSRFDTAAAFLVSFACAMQVQAFRTVNGYVYASTMCIGNLRGGTVAFSVYLREKKPEQMRRALLYFGIILFFAFGAGVGGNLSQRLGIHTIWICCLLLLISFFQMFQESLN